jgi:tRNA pseudouridine55 synthase
MNSKDILLIDKPSGITSFDVIRILRRTVGKKKMGHAGTLDPLATGLLLIGIEGGTKKLKDLIGLDKEYIAEILLGTKTVTGDIDGEVIETKPVPTLSEKHAEKEYVYVKETLKSLVGTLELSVPAYSAIKKDGKPLYKYAYQGKTVNLPIKPMRIIETELLEIKDSVITARFVVGSGTYIRSLAEELGKKLGTVATIKNLRRTKIGDFSVVDAEKIA